MEEINSNKRIAKNTLLLYFRMFFMMGISLYTSRVILQVLGVEDYGIYNVVGGMVSIFGLISGSMSSATQRYITIALGEGNQAKLSKVFSVALQIHAGIALITFLFIETVGLWFLYTQMQIPAERMDAAFWVLQFSAVTFVFSILSIPYNAAIISHERMSVFAYISLLEAVLKLGIVFLLLAIPFDKLIVYGALLWVTQISIQLCYMRYCYKHFPESHYRPYRDKDLVKEMAAFAGWNMFGSMSSIAFGQGLSMLLNVFFGPVVNAARAIAQQVQGAISMFISNFQMALNPQIIKNYAVRDFPAMHLLMARSSRFSYYLMWLLSLPVLFEAPFILQLWLGIVPPHTVVFLRIIIAVSLLYTITNPVLSANNATGKVRTYYIVCGSILISILPVSYVVLKLGCPVYSVFIVHFCLEGFTQVVRLFMVRKRLQLSIRKYAVAVYVPILLVTICSLLLPFGVYSVMEPGWGRFVSIGCTCVASVLVASWTLGLTRFERVFFVEQFRVRVLKK